MVCSVAQMHPLSLHIHGEERFPVFKLSSFQILFSVMKHFSFCLVLSSCAYKLFVPGKFCNMQKCYNYIYNFDTDQRQKVRVGY